MLKLNTIVSLGGLLAMVLLGGCSSMQCPIQRVQNAPPAAENTTPLVIDQAMQVRDWDRVTAHYANGDTIAGPTGTPYEVRWNQPAWEYVALETPLFVG